MNALYEEFKGRGFTVLLVNMGENPEVVRRVVKTRGYTAPVLLDAERQVSTAYVVTGTPTVYLVDRRLQIMCSLRPWQYRPSRSPARARRAPR